VWIKWIYIHWGRQDDFFSPYAYGVGRLFVREGEEKAIAVAIGWFEDMSMGDEI